MGLTKTLLPQLPSKLGTTVTTHEDDLQPGLPARTLSHAEWRKLFVARALAGAIASNESRLGPLNSLAKCLMGSVLLLDDILSFMNEDEEQACLQSLRRSGASTIIASGKWATGRYADHIVVLQNGKVAESGTHTELLSRGPKRSIYAARWQQMTS
jgi:ABC-type hemin transport system ATPase subunit